MRMWCNHEAPKMILVDFVVLHFPLSVTSLHSLLCLPLALTLALPLTLCFSDTVCYMSPMPECLVPTSVGTGDVWSIPLSPGNRHVRSPPLGADAGMEGREWAETSTFFFSPVTQLSVYIQTWTRLHKDSV